MKELFSKIRSGAKRSTVAMAKLAGFIVGRISWSPPAWLKTGQARFRAAQQAHPIGVASIIVGVFLTCCAAAWSWNWYSHLPKPHVVTADVRPIPVTPLEKELRYPLLEIAFSESAARLEDLGKWGLTGVRLEPAIPGTWYWSSDRYLYFNPQQDWPAETKFRIIFDKKFFPRQVRMEKLTYETQTPNFAAKILDYAFYQNPLKPGEHQLTATVELTHAVALEEVSKHLRFVTVSGNNPFPPADPDPHFSLSYGLHERRVYVRSSLVKLPEQEDFAKIMLSNGMRTKQGGARTHEDLEQKTRVPSLATVFRIESSAGAVAVTETGEPEQIIAIVTSIDISTVDLGRALDIRFLPKRPHQKPADEETSDGDDESASPRASHSEDDEDVDEEASSNEPTEEERWSSPGNVPPEVFESAKPVSFTVVPTDKPHDTQHSFRIRVESEGELFVRVRKGARALGDYPLVNDYDAVLRVPRLPREVKIEGEGGLLALNGERKLSIRSRGLHAIEYEIARVATSQINHLVSQTRGEFQNPNFRAPYFFNQENISRIALEHQSIAMENNWKANYSAFDFSEHLRKPADGGSERGLFFLTARGWDPAQKKSYHEVDDQRFLLITDIGIVTKTSETGGHDVFLLSIKNQKPLADATVEILGKNGVALQTAKADADGHCAFTAMDKSLHEKTPVAFVARNGDDVAFIPYERADRILNFSRFDVDGVVNALPENLDAFLFTERGVYRPGDDIHIGMVVKQRNWRGNLKGLPLEFRVTDARGTRVLEKRFTLPDIGLTEQNFQTAPESPLGLYRFSVHLIRNGATDILLGSTTAQVKEFLPDRMKIASRLSQSAGKGWIEPKDVRANIDLTNLYGTPATERRISARMDLSPTAFRFQEFPGYSFYDPMLDEKKDRQSHTVELGEEKTDENGQTEFELNLERFADATYQMHFVAEGFEAEGGRSVMSENSALVSALPYVIGCKAPAGLNYIEMNHGRAVDFVAVDSKLERIAVENLTLNVIAQTYVSVLSKQDNGNYAFESVLQEKIVKSEPITIAPDGFHFALPTDQPGTFVLELRNEDERRVSMITFCVVGRGMASRPLDKNAELQVKLDKSQYNSGDEIAISVTAPFSGSGLITIERDKVYAYQWFKTSDPSSIQHIPVPEGFEGTGYINVAFVRAMDSKEIFVSPLSYGVVPFTANMEKRRLKIDLQSAAAVKPGEPLRISYKADRPGKIVIFAVDQGILQVTDYKTPDPLAHLFRKCALTVETAQIVDLIIPEFSILKQFSAFGGGNDIQRLNPFKRVTEKPVVFWSGLLDADTNLRDVTYNVPDYFDGTLKIMAVAVSADATGATDRSTLVRGPFVITPSVPVLAAPGDEFEAGVTVANNVEGSGPDADIELRAETNEQVSIIGAASQHLRISEGREKSVSLRFRVNEKLGSGEIRFVAGRKGQETRRRATLSVRPPVPYVTDVRSGSFNKSSTDVSIARETYPQFRKQNASVSALPLGLAHGLDVYLKNYPHGCSEQITSGAFSRLLLADETDFGLTRAEVNDQLENTFGVLRRRQNSDGSFGYWGPGPTDRISFVSVYVTDFLSEAKASKFAPPDQMYASALRYLQRLVAQTPGDLYEARTVAYGIYVLSREGVITTNYILNLRDYLDKNQRDKWQNDITGVYLAGALHILQKDSEAENLIGRYKLGEQAGRECGDFFQPLGTDSQYVAVLAREFPNRIRRISGEEFTTIVDPIRDGAFNTLAAAYAVRALKAYARNMSQNLPTLTISELLTDKSEKNLTTGSRMLQRADFGEEARTIRFSSRPAIKGPGAFFQVIEAGFDRQMPKEVLTNGLEVYREILGKDNQAITQTHLGDVLHVRIHVRSLQSQYLTNVAIVDLLPGGFEIVDTSLRRGVRCMPNVDFVERREDRALFFTNVPKSALEIDYQIKSCNRGEFVVPPVFAESMYDRNVKGRGLAGRITVTQ